MATSIAPPPGKAAPRSPARLIRASLLQILYAIGSERQLMEQIDDNLLFRRFVGPGIDDAVRREGRQP